MAKQYFAIVNLFFKRLSETNLYSLIKSNSMMNSIGKKGIFGSIMMDLVHIIIVIIMVGILLFLAPKLFGAIFGGNANTETVKSFNALADNVQFMIDKPTSFEHQSMILYFEDNYYVFGLRDQQTLIDYNAAGSTMYTRDDLGGVRSTTTTIQSTSLPEKCNDRPCLCLYKDTKNFPEKPLACKYYDSQIIFHGYFGGSGGTSLTGSPGIVVVSRPVPPQSQSLYSDYPDELRLNYYHLALSNKGFAQDLYIEKFVKYGRTHILITPYLPQGEIEKRVALLSLCPDNSDPGCVNVPINSNIGAGFCYYDQSQQKCVLKQGVSQCPTSTKLTRNCVCGSRFIDVAEWSDVYCYRRPTDDRLIAMKFNCNGLAQGCVSYCNAISKETDDCSQEEIDFCNQNPCGFGPSISGNRCQVRQEGTKYYCEPVLS